VHTERSKKNQKYFKKISIGYNGREDFFSHMVLPFKDYISSVYSSPPMSLGFSSARFSPDVFPQTLQNLRMSLKKIGIEFNLVYNFDGVRDVSIIDKTIEVANYFEPDIVTVNGTFFIDKFTELTDYKINISIINDINTLNQLNQLMERSANIVSYNIGRRKTFDLNYIRTVKAMYPDLKLKLMVNEGCIFECPDQNFHSCSMTIANEKPLDMSVFYCHKLSHDQHWRFLTGQYIPPKYLHNYCDIVDEFKIATRGLQSKGLQTEFAANILSQYINEKDVSLKEAMLTSYGGSFFAKKYFDDCGNGINKENRNCDEYDKKYPDDFFNIRASCLHECFMCNYCKKILNS
jgi:hypothetical protein